ncbi:hypothetical protein HYFRA_00000196 [Hymenoscyphus fraxineus]|uniref:UAS domain-containing protein n=1 Tax=Hymenoscyphus fraxineus TaxID=746836 RepID=A0A9N9L3D7_9HELO|nr:hypothetical protein HYFRA_00000196 [Hymenoscyphus fraxineus]
MDSDAVDMFVAVTGKSQAVARRYLEMTENNGEQAVALFFESPDLAAGADEPAAPPLPSNTRPQPAPATGPRSSNQVIDLDDEDEDMEEVEEDEQASAAAAIGQAADFEDDEAMARRLQEEFYAGGDAAGGVDADGVRAPIASTRETLMGPDADWGSDDIHQAVQYQMQRRLARGRGGRSGVFNQQNDPSIWDNTAAGGSSSTPSQATAGETVDSKSARLAKLFRPPFDLMKQIPWDTARDMGKEEKKWIMVNIQDPSIFDCQLLNRDIWANQGINELVRENFVFLQYSKDDPRANQYLQYYFPGHESPDSYPHISIIDPRTGEKMKTWSGPKKLDPVEFLMQLVEFLDRYSLDPSIKNPVAKHKPEKPKAFDVGRLTEQEMLDLALENSLSTGSSSGPKEHDPDDLTKSFGDVGKGKGREGDATEASNGQVEESEMAAPSTYSRILSDRPHVEPEQGPGVTRIQFRHANGRVIRKFKVDDPVSRLYEWLKADPLEGKKGIAFDLRMMGKDLSEVLEETIEAAGLKNGTVMVEYLEE